MNEVTNYQGRIIRGIAGFFYVAEESGFLRDLYACRAKGIFRKEKVKPLVGDRVVFEITDEKDKEGNITEILPRKNELIRPAVANIDQGMLVFAFASPKPNLRLLDRFLVNMRSLDIPVAVCFNKSDLSGDEESKIREMYAGCGCALYFISAINGIGIGEIREHLKGKLTVLAGPSGVGKSSIVNRLQSEVEMETGDISKKLGRGRHTTRRAELIAVGEDGYVIDTPGFTSLEIQQIAKEDLQYYYPEFEPYLGQCRYNVCCHLNEPDCAVKEAVSRGDIHPGRYDTYCALYHELEEGERNQYR